jgi:DNA repair protein RecN (Recombination protein N)
VLTELQITNLGVIEELRIDIGAGLTALTGETGTGKTVLLGAISLFVGGRADADLVRPGAGEARVDGRFLLPTNAVPADLLGEPAPPGSFVEIVISRVVPRNGRSRAYINGHLVTVGALAEITASHVSLHGQHAHQSLLSTQTQRAALDEYGKIDTSKLTALRARLQACEAQRKDLGGDERARAREIDLLSFQITEIDQAGIDDLDEQAVLTREEELLADARGHAEAGAEAVTYLFGDRAARDLFGDAVKALGDRSPFSSVSSRLQDLLAELDDLGADLRSITESIEEDPDRMEQIRLRRQSLRDLCRKYGADLAEVLRYRGEAQVRLAMLSDHEVQAERIDAEIAEVEGLLVEESQRIRAARTTVGPLIASAIQEGLHRLAMPHAKVEVAFGSEEMDPPGDRVEFMLAANPGLESAPLHKVASGGELARAMLALRLTLHAAESETAVVPNPETGSTLIFDEVDAGIGGAAALAVAQALHRLVGSHQVLVVTHLAQVAAVADHHLRVVKTASSETTVAVVDAVEGKDRVHEIARMLSGHHTDAAMRHATELLSGHLG